MYSLIIRWCFVIYFSYFFVITGVINVFVVITMAYFQRRFQVLVFTFHHMHLTGWHTGFSAVWQTPCASHSDDGSLAKETCHG